VLERPSTDDGHSGEEPGRDSNSLKESKTSAVNDRISEPQAGQIKNNLHQAHHIRVLRSKDQKSKNTPSKKEYKRQLTCLKTS
jgi:hypothetical protein